MKWPYKTMSADSKKTGKRQDEMEVLRKLIREDTKLPLLFTQSFYMSRKWQIVRQTRFFSLGEAPSLGEGKLWIQTC